MKYLDILKKYDESILSESKQLDVECKKLDDIYKKLLGESCEDGEKKEEETKSDDATKDGEKKELSEGCDEEKKMKEFTEGENEDGKSAKKMLSKDEFFGGEGEKKDGETASDDDTKSDETKDGDDGEKKVDEDDLLKGRNHNGHVDENEHARKTG